MVIGGGSKGWSIQKGFEFLVSLTSIQGAPDVPVGGVEKFHTHPLKDMPEQSRLQPLRDWSLSGRPYYSPFEGTWKVPLTGTVT
jgi:hypothetical protein